MLKDIHVCEYRTTRYTWGGFQFIGKHNNGCFKSLAYKKLVIMKILQWEQPLRKVEISKRRNLGKGECVLYAKENAPTKRHKKWSWEKKKAEEPHIVIRVQLLT